jgi:hypothetical protein
MFGSVLPCGHELARLFPRPNAREPCGRNPGGTPMSDVLYTALSIAFFVLAAVFAAFCRKVR